MALEYISNLILVKRKIEMFVSQHIIMITFMLQFGILIYFIASGHLMYALNDDTLKVTLAGGGNGVPSEYLGYNTIHIILGKVFKMLFSLFPIVNWMTIFYLLVENISFAVLHLLIFHQGIRNNVFLRFCYSIISAIAFFLCLEHFTFTVVAYTAAIAGGVSFSLNILLDIKRKENVIIGILAIALASMIRPAVCQAIIVVLGICSLFVFIKYKKIAGILFCLLIALIMQLFVISNESIVCQSEIEQKFYEWSSIRCSALDKKKVSWDENKEILEENGISKDVYDIIYGARYIDKEAVSIENLQLLKELNVYEEKYNFNLNDYFSGYFSFLKNLGETQSIYKLLFWFVFILVLLYIKKIEIIIVGITPIFVESIFIFMNRTPYRVIMPVYLFGIILLLLECEKFYVVKNKNKSNYRIVALLGGLSVILLLIHGDLNYWRNFNFEWEENCLETLNYMEKHQNKLFLPISSDLYALEIYRPVFKFSGQNGRCFLCGNGDAFSEPYYSALEYYDIQNPDRIIFETVDNSDVYFLGTSDVVNANKLYQCILNHVYTETRKKVVLEKIEDITVYLSAYKMVSIN